MADYGFEHNGSIFTPNGTAVAAEDNTDRNAAIEQWELAEWRMRPRAMMAYFHFPADGAHTFGPTPGFPYRCAVCGVERHLSPELCSRTRQYRDAYRPNLYRARVTSWPGSELGTIVEANVYRHNYGHRFISLKVRGTNGAMYHGRASFDWGQCVRLHRSK